MVNVLSYMRNALLRFFYVGTIVSMTSCGAGHSKIGSFPKEPPLGLYQVIERTCQYPPGSTDECQRVQYIELVRGTFYGVEENEAALVFWTQGNEPTYTAFKLRGRFINDREYLVSERPDLERETLLINGDSVSGYLFVKYRNPGIGSEATKNQYVLKRINRTPSLNKLLAYPESD
jgi:hypothetical protein